MIKIKINEGEATKIFNDIKNITKKETIPTTSTMQIESVVNLVLSQTQLNA